MPPVYEVMAYGGIAALCAALGIALGAWCGRVVRTILALNGVCPALCWELGEGAAKWMITARRASEIGVVFLIASVPVEVVTLVIRFVKAVTS